MTKAFVDFVERGDKGILVHRGFRLDNKENIEMLEKKLLRRIKTMYKYYLIKNRNINISELYEMDMLMKKISPRLYALSSKFVVSSPVFPFRYVRSWRRNGKSRRFNLLIMLYRFLNFHFK